MKSSQGIGCKYLEYSTDESQNESLRERTIQTVRGKPALYSMVEGVGSA